MHALAHAHGGTRAQVLPGLGHALLSVVELLHGVLQHALSASVRPRPTSEVMWEHRVQKLQQRVDVLQSQVVPSPLSPLDASEFGQGLNSLGLGPTCSGTRERKSHWCGMAWSFVGFWRSGEAL